MVLSRNLTIAVKDNSGPGLTHKYMGLSSNDQRLLLHTQIITASIYELPKRFTSAAVNTTPKRQLQTMFSKTTPTVGPSPEPLIVYPYLHRKSQCCSCSTVMPGDICFNCGRLSTLLVTPRPPRNSFGHTAPATNEAVPPQSRPVSKNQPFEQQYTCIQELLTAKDRPTKPYPMRPAFDSQLIEVDGLLDARIKLAQNYFLAARDAALLDDGDSKVSSDRSPSSSKFVSDASTAYSSWSSTSSSQTPRSDSFAISDVLSESGAPYAHIVEQWLEGSKSPKKSSTKLTRRGVDCRLNLAGRSCEWVIFL